MISQSVRCENLIKTHESRNVAYENYLTRLFNCYHDFVDSEYSYTHWNSFRFSWVNRTEHSNSQILHSFSIEQHLFMHCHFIWILKFAKWNACCWKESKNVYVCRSQLFFIGYEFIAWNCCWHLIITRNVTKMKNSK